MLNCGMDAAQKTISYFPRINFRTASPVDTLNVSAGA
jgi:hypothetical protein